METWKLLLSATPATKQSIIQKQIMCMVSVLLHMHCMLYKSCARLPAPIPLPQASMGTDVWSVRIAVMLLSHPQIAGPSRHYTPASLPLRLHHQTPSFPV